MLLLIRTQALEESLHAFLVIALGHVTPLDYHAILERGIGHCCQLGIGLVAFLVDLDHFRRPVEVDPAPSERHVLETSLLGGNGRFLCQRVGLGKVKSGLNPMKSGWAVSGHLLDPRSPHVTGSSEQAAE